MSDLSARLEVAHRLAARATGRLALLLARRRVSARELEAIAGALRGAAESLDGASAPSGLYPREGRR